jgi:hypothetical protein
LALAADKEEIRSLHAKVTELVSELGECRSLLRGYEAANAPLKIMCDASTDTSDIIPAEDVDAPDAKKRRTVDE